MEGLTDNWNDEQTGHAAAMLMPQGAEKKSPICQQRVRDDSNKAITADDILKYFSQKIGFDISCNLHEMSKPIF